MRIPEYSPSIREEILERDIFGFDFIMQSGKQGNHYLFDGDKVKIYLRQHGDEDGGLTVGEKSKFGTFITDIVTLPSLQAKRDYINGLSFDDQKKLFKIYMSMVEQYDLRKSPINIQSH